MPKSLLIKPHSSILAAMTDPAAPILARLAALQALLAAPQAHARRRARALDRQRRTGEAAPMALPMPRTHRMRQSLAP